MTLPSTNKCKTFEEDIIISLVDMTLFIGEKGDWVHCKATAVEIVLYNIIKVASLHTVSLYQRIMTLTDLQAAILFCFVVKMPK